MWKKLADLTGYTIQTKDGEIGICNDFLFDDRTWMVRYLVVKTLRWLPGRKVVISPVFLDEPDWPAKCFSVRLTKQQIEDSPPLDEHAPVSRQYEIAYHQFYTLPFYWVSNGSLDDKSYPSSGVIETIPDRPVPQVDEIDVTEGPLRSIKEVTGYDVVAIDGESGHIDDFLADERCWNLRYVIVHTHNWLPGGRVLLSTQWLRSINWTDRKAYTDLDIDIDTIRNSPDFDPAQLVTREYESLLYDHYSRPYYWE